MQPQKKATMMKLECLGSKKGHGNAKQCGRGDKSPTRAASKAAMTKQECRGLQKGSRQCKIPTMTTLLLTCWRVDCYFFCIRKFQNFFLSLQQN